MKNAKKDMLYFILVFILAMAFFDREAIGRTITLAWDANSEPNISYKVFKRSQGNTYDYSAPVGITRQTQYSLSIGNDETCYFVVKAFNLYFPSEDSNEIMVEPIPAEVPAIQTSVQNTASAYYTYEGSAICDGVRYNPNGNYWDMQPINSRSEFSLGQEVCLFAQLANVSIDHEWKFEIWKNGSLLESFTRSYALSGGFWEFSNYDEKYSPISTGTYELRIFVRTVGDYALLEKKVFIISDNGASAIPIIESGTIPPPPAPTPITPAIETGSSSLTLEFDASTNGFVLEDNTGSSYGFLSTGKEDDIDCLIVENSGQSQEQWKIQAKNGNIDLGAGNVYTHRIKLRGTGVGIIYALIEKSVSPWNNLGLFQAIPVTQDWKTYSVSFRLDSSSDPATMRYSLQIGGYKGEIYVNSISFTEISP